MRRFFFLAPLLIVGCLTSVPQPNTIEPQPLVSKAIEDSAAKGWTLYHERLPAAFEGLAVRLRNNEFKTQQEFATEMERVTREARLGAFDEMRKAWQQENPDPWDSSADANRCEQTAAGLRKAK